MIHRRLEHVLGAPVDALSWDDALARIAVWSDLQESRAVYFCNAHATVSRRRNPALAQAYAAADLVLPDGAPVAWMLRQLGHPEQQRMAGPDLMVASLAQAAENGHSVFLLGGTRSTLRRLRRRLRERFPELRLAGMIAPPFRPLTEAEDERLTRHIIDSGAQLVFVALGCPKQEQWIHAHQGRIPAVLMGVGAAFDFLAGTQPRAPRWMRSRGLEWLWRLRQEPRRLAWRYLDTHSVFVVGASLQWAGHRLRRAVSALRRPPAPGR